MLGKAIKEKIESTFGQQVKYPRDCDAVAADIASKTNQRISGSTVRRLFGFIKGTTEPRSFTLDVIAEYVGYTCFEKLIDSFNEKQNHADKVIEELTPDELNPGKKIRIQFDQRNEIGIEFLGESKFKINESSCELLLINDVVSLSKVKLHQPLFIDCHTRENNPIGPTVLAKVSGVKSIYLYD